MNANTSYNARKVLGTIVKALENNRVDVLKKCHEQLSVHNDEHILLELYAEDYEKYHELLLPSHRRLS